MLNMTDKKYFKSMLFVVGLLFILTSFSIICCIVKSSTVSDAQNSSHIMSIVYMVLQLVMEAVVFYYAFKAMVNGSSLIKTVMYVKEDVINTKSKRNALIVFTISSALAAYMCVTLLPINIFLSFFALGLRFALANFFMLLAVVSIYFFCYVRKPEEK